MANIPQPAARSCVSDFTLLQVRRPPAPRACARARAHAQRALCARAACAHRARSSLHGARRCPSTPPRVRVLLCQPVPHTRACRTRARRSQPARLLLLLRASPRRRPPLLCPAAANSPRRRTTPLIPPQELGKGSYGVVQKVLRKQDKQLYALKIVNIKKLQPREREDAVNEIRVLASIKHRNIVRYCDAFVEKDS